VIPPVRVALGCFAGVSLGLVRGSGLEWSLRGSPRGDLPWAAEVSFPMPVEVVVVLACPGCVVRRAIFVRCVPWMPGCGR